LDVEEAVPVAHNPPKFLLMCDTTHSRFVLGREGEPWRKEFQSLQESLEYASSIAVEETRFSVCNEVGRTIIETTVTPIDRRQD
jgi:hypothetical protein